MFAIRSATQANANRGQRIAVPSVSLPQLRTLDGNKRI